MEESFRSGDIAIIGLACRFPGNGTNPEALWAMLKKGEDAWSVFPHDRLNIEGFHHPSGNRQGSLPFKGAHFLKGNVAGFDAAFFNISAAEAKALDPQQRVLLETTYEAIESAGIPIESLDGSDTSVNIGSFVKDYEQICMRDDSNSPQYAATGTGAAILANRISHFFNLTGPSQTIDTGCSGSLVAVHNGCQDLRSGRSSLAIAGGVGMILTPATMMPMTQLQFLSPNGRCFTFSEKADGYGRGEGVGVVILKRLEDAVRDNDTVRAVIRGSRTNQDGRTPGITMPSTQAQVSNIKSLYSDFGLDTDKTAYVECHGTGTQAGDPKEVSAIHQSFCLDHRREHPIIVGSIKPNIGHLEGAAGVAGLIKAVLIVERGQIPKNLHFEAPGNPLIKFKEWNVKVPTELMPWPSKGVRRVSVNCFGFGGTNAHVVLDDAANYFSKRQIRGRHQCTISPGDDLLQSMVPLKNFRPTQIFLLSSHEKSGIGRILDSHAPYIQDRHHDVELMPNYAYTLSRRSSLEYKTFIIASSRSDLLKKMQHHSTLQVTRSGAPKVALVFCGQGAQWSAMGRELMAYETFSYSVIGASKYLKKILQSDFILHDELMKDEKVSRIHDPDIAQPATTAIQIALVDLLRSSGLIPTATVGHSSGEIAAAYAAGYLNHEDAWKIAFKRGQLASSLKHHHPKMKGTMLAVGLSGEDVQPYVDNVKAGTVVVACHNSPASATLSGEEEQILELHTKLVADNIFARLLKVKVAYHSHHMRILEEDYRESISDIVPNRSEEAPQMFSSVTGKVISSEDLGPEYWALNLVSPVLFKDAFTHLYTTCRPDIILEIGPSAVLQRPMRENMEAIAPKKASTPCFSMLNRNQDASITALEVFGKLWAQGCSVDLSWSFKSREDIPPRLLIDLPPYPWNHSKTYWHESHMGKAMRFRGHGREDLIGAPASESTPQEPRWRGFFRMSENPWMIDHQVQKTVIYPAAGLVTMAIEAARQSVDSSLSVIGFEILDLVIHKPIVIPSTEHGLEHAINAKMMKTMTAGNQVSSTEYAFTIYTKALDGPWQKNAAGFYKILYGREEDDVVSHLDAPYWYRLTYQEIVSRVKKEIIPRQLYERLDTIGMNYGPLFRNIIALRKNQNACTSVVRIPDTKAKMPAKFEYDHLIHPAFLDSVFQTVFAIGDESMVPSYMKRIFVSAAMPRGAGEELAGYATAERVGLREARADITMSDSRWRAPLIIAEGLKFTSITTSGSSGFLPFHRNLCSQIVWEPYVATEIPEEKVCQSLCKKAYSVLLILPDGFDDFFNEQCRDLCCLIHRLLERAGFTVTTTLFSNLFERDLNTLCISLVDLDLRNPVFFGLNLTKFEKLQKLLTSTTGLLWITIGGQMDVDNPLSAPFHALARTIRSEDSSKAIFTLDLQQYWTIIKGVTEDLIVNILHQMSGCFLASDSPEVDFAERGGRLYVPRLAILSDLSDVIEEGPSKFKRLQTCPISAARRALNVEISNPGDIDSIRFQEDDEVSRDLNPDEICVEIISTRLFPDDLDTVLGKGHATSIGADIFGKVVKVGNNVVNHGLVPCEIGHLITALAHDTLRTRTIIKAEHVIEILPAHEDKMPGYSPSCLVSAYYGMVVIGQLADDDIVFIHAAASALGQTAMSLARSWKARVIAGVTTDKQRDYLIRCGGIGEDDIVNTSRDRVKSSVRRLTGGRGVHIVFGSTPETQNLDHQCVNDCGYIIQTSTRDDNVRPQTSGGFQSTASIVNIDLRKLIQQRPKLIQRLIHEVKMVLKEKLDTSSISISQSCDVSNLTKTFHKMQEDPYMGAFTISISPVSIVQTAFNPMTEIHLDPGASYVIVGGFGGLGRTVAKLLVSMGARHLAFFSRSGGTDESSRSFLSKLHRQGIRAKAYAVDISDRSQLVSTIERMKEEEMPRIKGVIQAAAVLRDSIFENMSYDDWMTATLPKIKGSWNLHLMLPDTMDFMIFLSSAAGVIGNRGQANYAAGNNFQDALARHRKARGLHTVSLDLGPILGAGMVAEDEATLDILKSSGFFGIRIEDFRFLVERAIAGSVMRDRPLPAQIVTGVGTGGLIMQNRPSDPYWTRTALFKRLNQVDLPPEVPTEDGSKQSVESIKVALRATTGLDEASRIVCTALINFLAPSLNMEPSEIDDSKSLSIYGVDSLVATNIRNWVFRNVAVKLTDMEVMGASSILELAKTIATKGGYIEEAEE